MHVCMHVCMPVFTIVYMHVCMHACMHACMYMHACLYVCTYISIYVNYTYLCLWGRKIRFSENFCRLCRHLAVLSAHLCVRHDVFIYVT